jgi:drug/metabolite transporter (DMT)-like permease
MFSAGLTVATSGVAALAGDWSWPPPLVLMALMAAGGFSLLGQWCTIVGVRSGELSVVVPFRYSIIIFAIISGIFVFGQFPDALTLLGIAIVCGAGLYTFHRERVRRAEALAKAQGAHR